MVIFFFYEKYVVLLAMLRGVEMSLLFYVIVLIVNQFTVNVVTLLIYSHVKIYVENLREKNETWT